MRPPKTKHPFKLALIWISICVIGRVMPHPYNATPLTSLSLFSGFSFKRWQALLVTACSLFLSDALLAWLQGYAIFGGWSVFTYSGLLMIAFAGAFSARLPAYKYSLLYTLLATLAFWMWTNFGAWLLFSDTYAHSAAGLAACFLAGLPFLRNALLGSFLWSSAIYYFMHRVTIVPHAKTAL